MIDSSKFIFAEQVYLYKYGLIIIIIVVTDRYSRFPEVEIVKSTKASIVIPKLDKIFAVHGIPLTVKSDNGPPFNGDEYDKYFKVLGIYKDLSTPVWPQANAEVERFMQPLTKAFTNSSHRKPSMETRVKQVFASIQNHTTFNKECTSGRTFV